MADILAGSTIKIPGGYASAGSNECLDLKQGGTSS
jgi:hypothetical protein